MREDVGAEGVSSSGDMSWSWVVKGMHGGNMLKI